MPRKTKGSETEPDDANAPELTPRHRRFADEYLLDLNATAAYKRAGYVAEGNSAEVNACRLLSNAKVAEYIAEKQRILQERHEITQDRILQEYAKLAFLDPRRFYDENGSLIPVQNLHPDVAAALGGMDIVVERNGENEDGTPKWADTKKIKFSDKRAALDSLSRTLGMFTDKVANTNTNLNTNINLDAGKFDPEKLETGDLEHLLALMKKAKVIE